MKKYSVTITTCDCGLGISFDLGTFDTYEEACKQSDPYKSDSTTIKITEIDYKKEG